MSLFGFFHFKNVTICIVYEKVEKGNIFKRKVVLF